MLAALLVNKYIFGAVMLFALIVMMHEFLRMTMGNRYRFSQVLAILAGTTLFSLTFFYKSCNLPGGLVILTFIPIFIVMVNSLYVKDKSEEFGKFAYIYTSILYVAVPWTMLNFAAFSYDSGFDGTLLLSFFCIVWGSDVGAYVFGMSLGQRFGKKLFPSISPKKSWIGFWGGMVTAVLVAIVLHHVGLLDFSLIHCVALSLVMNVTGVFGDLIESLWKRQCNVKDSGNIIPGHGGLLDRFDSALIAIPMGVLYLVVVAIL